MLALDDLLRELNYDGSPHYRETEKQFEPETVHLFRAAREAGVCGVYVFETSPHEKDRVLPARPAVFVADVQGSDSQEAEREALRLHRRVWNLSSVPFLIVRLPHQVRVYTGFSYSPASEQEEGLLGKEDRLAKLGELLSELRAEAIDSGRIWQSEYGRALNTNQRVDKRLLRNLKQLGDALKQDGLRREVAHALIGKYVYVSYLRSRGIVSDAWLAQQQITPESVLTLEADVASLRKLVQALEKRFNGQIFPIDFDGEPTLKDKHVSWVASIFSGSQIVHSAPQAIQQLHLPFQAYDFRYIPVETFSAIYEQFIDQRKEKGAIYTPEFLADYLLSEVEWAKPLERGMKILDPACGSGVFLVLAYRRLIEKEMARLERPLEPEELRTLLLESIYGVERERDACYVTEFSLILTLLHYVEADVAAFASKLENLSFQFPALHNQQIFESDFFDLKAEPVGAIEGKREATEGKREATEGKREALPLHFDWIVGNPPWITLNSRIKGEGFVRAWMKDPHNKATRPIGGNRVAEAFSWLVTDLLSTDGVAGLLLPATSLFNLNSKKYRQRFFSEHEVLRVTNFANLRNVLFGKGKSDVLPAATIIYRRYVAPNIPPDIVHYGPFAVNQLSQTTNQPWSITINENEIQSLSPYEAEKGETSFWKLALWGSYIDKRAIERIEYLFPMTLKEVCQKLAFHFHEGSQLRDVNRATTEKLAHVPTLRGGRRFDTNSMKHSLLRFSIEPTMLPKIPDEMCYLRVRGGKKGLDVAKAPHIIISPVWQHYIIYSDEDFVIPPRQMGIAASSGSPEHAAEHLRALSVYLNSSLVAYYLFFHAQQWGVFRRARLVSIREVRKIPTPFFTSEQVEELATLQRELVEIERREVSQIVANLSSMRQKRLPIDPPEHKATTFTLPIKLSSRERKQAESAISELRAELQQKIDDKIFALFQIRQDLRILVREMVDMRLSLDKSSTTHRAIRKPLKAELVAYGHMLRDVLDDFVMGTAYHRVTINDSSELIECVIEMTQQDAPIPVTDESVQASDLTTANLLAELSEGLREEVSQWVYVQRGLRLFDEPRIYLYKSPRVIEWTQTQAIKDAGEIIGQILATTWIHDENQQT